MNNKIENKIINSLMNELKNEFSESLISGRLYESVILTMINFDRNKDMLSGMVYRRFMEFAIVPKWNSITMDGKGCCYISISNALVEFYDLDLDELFKHAYDNTLNKKGYELLSLDSFVETGELSLVEPEPLGEHIYILTNGNLEYGAVMLYIKEVLANIYDRFNHDFYIIPSSVNELLIFFDVPVCGIQGIKDLIKLVNEDVVSGDIFLSDNLYYYNGKLKEICVI